MKLRMNFAGASRLFFIVFTLIGIGVVVGVHEFGHLLACKLFDVYAPTYSIGFGPAVLQKKIGTTIYQLAPIPLGGYTQVVEKPANKAQEIFVHLHGEKFFNEIPYWQKFIIMIAGVAFNLIFAWLIFFILFLFPGRFATKAADTSGNLAEQSHDERPSVIVRAFAAPTVMLGTMLKVFSGIASRKSRDAGVTIGGPIMFFSESIKSLHSGFRFFCVYIAGFSVSLAFFNILPIPLLDGGRIVMVTLETVVGHQIPENVKMIIYLFCLFLMVVAMSLLSARDISRLAKQKREQ